MVEEYPDLVEARSAAMVALYLLISTYSNPPAHWMPDPQIALKMSFMKHLQNLYKYDLNNQNLHASEPQ